MAFLIQSPNAIEVETEILVFHITNFLSRVAKTKKPADPNHLIYIYH